MKTIDQAILDLQAAKEKIGGDKLLFVNVGGNRIKWDELHVTDIAPVDDGESVYVKLNARKLVEQTDGTMITLSEHNRRLGEAEATLKAAREEAAQEAFEKEVDEDSIADCGRWNDDGIYWSIPVYWKGEDEDDDSVSGSFGVEFKEGTAEIVEHWQQ